MDLSSIKVSIIVPVFNVECYVEDCVKSLINQTHKNIEILLINDGSYDKSLSIIKELAISDSRIKIISNDNHGVSYTRNCGIKSASGEYICFVDSDDYVSVDYVEYLLSLAIKYETPIALTDSFFTTFNESNNLKDKITVLSGREAAISILHYKIPIGVYCKIFNASFLIENNVLFDEKLSIGEGFNFNTFAFQRAPKVAIGRKKIYYYRRNNPTSATTLFSANKWENGLYAIKCIQDNKIFNDEKFEKALKYALRHTNRDVCDFILVAKAKKENLALYKQCRHVSKKYFYLPMLTNVSFKEKIRGILVLLVPSLIPLLMRRRLKKANNRRMQ